MARAKKANPTKDAFQARIDAVTKETANDLYVELNESEELTATAKQELNIALQVKMQAYEQVEQDASAKPLAPVEVSVPSDKRSKAKKGSLPSWVKAVSATEEQVMKYQENGKLFGHDPVKGIAYIVASLLIALMVLAPVAIAGTEATLGDRESDGDYRWEVQAGNLVPGTTATYNIGSASKYVGTIYTSNLVATQYSVPTIYATTSLVTPMLKLNATASTSRPASGATAGSIVAINDSNSVANCGAAGTGGSTYVVCVSNGTNWVVL